MSTEVVEIVSRAVSFAGEPLSDAQRAAYEHGERLRLARHAAAFAVMGRIGPNGPNGPARDAEVLMAAGFFPVGSIQSPDYAAAPPGIATI